MPKDGYEFGYMSKREKLKVLAAKVFLAAMIAFCFYQLLSGPIDDLGLKLSSTSGIFAAVFGYINLLNVKSELVELFESPVVFTGYEFIVASVVLEIASWLI